MALAMTLLMYADTSAVAATATGSISGHVTDAENNSPLPYCRIQIAGSSRVCATDEAGDYKLDNLAPGT